VRISIARSAPELDSWRGIWERLYRQSATATLFQSFAWNRLAAQYFAGREMPWVVLAQSDAGAAIIPAAIAQRRLGFLGEMLFDYRDVLWTGDQKLLWAAWKRLAVLESPLEVSGLRDGAGREAWREFRLTPYVHAPQIKRAETDAEEFAARHTRLARNLRRLVKHGASVHRYCGSSAALIRWIYERKAAQPGVAHNLFRDPVRVDFMVAACAMEPDDCDLFTLEVRGTPIAALVTFRDRNTRRFYTIYFDENWARYSPGTTLCFEVARRTLAGHLDCDFMTGEQPHKTRLMTSAMPLFRVEMPAETLARTVQDGEMTPSGRAA